MSQQVAIHQSIKLFLEKKGMISAAQALVPGFPPVVELAYKDYAKHRVGVPHPVQIPQNLLQMPAKILDDADWNFLEHLIDAEEFPAEEPVAESGTSETTVTAPAPAPAPAPTPVAAPAEPTADDNSSEGEEGSDEGSEEEPEETPNEQNNSENENPDAGSEDAGAEDDKA